MTHNVITQNERWTKARRIVVKIGSALLTDRETGCLKTEWLKALGDDVKTLREQGCDVILVSSGAIALGRGQLGLSRKILKLEEAQAAAAVGQVHLAHAYQEIFRERDLITAQILLTPSDTEKRRRYLNARSTIETLLQLGAIPVVNENDTVATSEIRYGDNDRLGARVATMMTADVLVLLSDIDGLYTAPPATDSSARHIDIVDTITPEIEAMAGDAGTELSRGGMKTKIVAAKIAVSAGTHMVIASGKIMHPLRSLSEGVACTWFLAQSNPVTARKRWIAGTLEPKGVVTVDEGACFAIQSGRSLLPAGVTSVTGHFQRGDAVSIQDCRGRELGRGLVRYDAHDASVIAGRKTLDIEKDLALGGSSALIHRDDMALHRDSTRSTSDQLS